MFNIDAVRDAIKNKAKEMVKNKVANIAEQQQNYLQQEFKVDLAQSEDRSLVEKFADVQTNVVQAGDTNYTIEVSMDGLSEHDREVLAFYFDNAKRRLKA